MIELTVLAMLAVVGVAMAALVGTVLFIVKAVLWLVLLPFRLLFGMMSAVIGLAFGAIGLVAGVALLPVLLAGVAVVAAIAVVGALLSLLLPLIPFVLLGLVVWAIFFRDKQPVSAPPALR
jgi:hypothetical protein